MVCAEAENIVRILDSEYPSVRLLDQSILDFFELLMAYNWLSHSCLSKILRFDYVQSIENFREKCLKFLAHTGLTGHIHSHFVTAHLQEVLEQFQCGLACVSPDHAIENLHSSLDIFRRQLNSRPRG